MLGIAVAVDLRPAALALGLDRRARPGSSCTTTGRRPRSRRARCRVVSLARLPSASIATPSCVTSKAMCGRLGSTLTVCAWPMWLISASSFGLAGSVTSMISRPPLRAALCARRTCPGRGSGPARPSRRSAAARRARSTNGFGLLRRCDVPFGVASTSCCRPVALDVGARAGGRRVAADVGRADLAALGQPDDRLPAGVRAGAERPDRRVGLALVREEVEVGVRVARRDRRDAAPTRRSRRRR